MRICLLIGVVIWCGCKRTSDAVIDDAPSPAVAMPAGSEAGALAIANNQFAVELWRKVAATRGNLAISPVSITTALAMVWRGAKGDTAAQMRAVLHFDADAGVIAPRWGRLSRALQDPGRRTTLRIANRLFGEAGYPFERAFVDDTRSAFGAAFEPVSFASGADAVRVHINDWVEQRTEHRIKDLLGPGALTRDTRLVLVNAIYFLADWANPFPKDSTVDQDFAGTTRKRVKTMHAKAPYRYAKSDGVAILEMPYKSNDVAMLVLLPDRADGLAELERTLDATRLAAWTATMTPAEVNVSLPRFTVDPAEPLALAEHLAALGMPAAFDPNTADFTDIAMPSDPTKRLCLSGVFHKAFVKVDEQGTEAAATTAVGGAELTSVRPPPIPFTADHPFLFAIIDTASGLVLFLGRVIDPS